MPLKIKTILIVALVVVVGFGIAIVAYYKNQVKRAEQVQLTQPHTFTHPEYGFSLTVPAGLKVVFNRHPTIRPPYDVIGIYNPKYVCKECFGPPEIRISVWKVDGTKTFSELLADSQYGAYIRKEQTLDSSKYRAQNGWMFYTDKNLQGEEVYYGYSEQDHVLLGFENTKMPSEMQIVINSLSFISAENSNTAANVPDSGDELTLHGVVVALKNDLPVDGSAVVTIRTDRNQAAEITYAQGWNACANYKELGSSIQIGDHVEVFAKVSQAKPLRLSTCDDPRYYIIPTQSSRPATPPANTPHTDTRPICPKLGPITPDCRGLYR